MEVVAQERVGPIGTVGAVIEGDGAGGSVAAALNGGAGLEGPGFVVGEFGLVAGEEGFEVVPTLLRGEEVGEAGIGLGLVGEAGFAGAEDVEDAVAHAIQAKGLDAGKASAAALQAVKSGQAGSWPDLSGGYKYLQLERMAYYVNKDAYRNAVRQAAAAQG